jgi:hypothetical protein
LHPRPPELQRRKDDMIDANTLLSIRNLRTYFRYHEPVLLRTVLLDVTPRGRIAARAPSSRAG